MVCWLAVANKRLAPLSLFLVVVQSARVWEWHRAAATRGGGGRRWHGGGCNWWQWDRRRQSDCGGGAKVGKRSVGFSASQGRHAGRGGGVCSREFCGASNVGSRGWRAFAGTGVVGHGGGKKEMRQRGDLISGAFFPIWQYSHISSASLRTHGALGGRRAPTPHDSHARGDTAFDRPADSVPAKFEIDTRIDSRNNATNGAVPLPQVPAQLPSSAPRKTCHHDCHHALTPEKFFLLPMLQCHCLLHNHHCRLVVLRFERADGTSWGMSIIGTGKRAGSGTVEY